MLGLESLDIVVVTGIAVTIATQVLKSSYVSFLPAERYPRLTVIAVSAVAAPVALSQTGVALPDDVTGWVALGAAVVLVAVGTYHGIFKRHSKDPLKNLR